VPIRNGASPVASALSIRSGATPRGPIHTNTPLSNPPSEPDISTLLGLGRFYFAATLLSGICRGQIESSGSSQVESSY